MTDVILCSSCACEIYNVIHFYNRCADCDSIICIDCGVPKTDKRGKLVYVCPECAALEKEKTS